MDLKKEPSHPKISFEHALAMTVPKQRPKEVTCYIIKCLVSGCLILVQYFNYILDGLIRLPLSLRGYLAGFGKYNVTMLVICCLLILAMYTDIFGFSVVLPSIACDMQLSTAQQGLLSAIPLIGVMFSSYGWGFCADSLGRKTTLLLAMPVGMLFNIAASLSPTFSSLAALKFISASFTSSANAAGFVLAGESVPASHRSRVMFLMASATMYVQFVICVMALPVLTGTSFNIYLSWIALEYRPWRLLMLIICIPGILGVVGVIFLCESPKFLLLKGCDETAVEVLKKIYKYNTGLGKHSFPATSIYLDESKRVGDANAQFLRVIWNQTAPLFQTPLRNNNLKLYFILLCAFMTSTGFTMWVPTMTNAFFNGEESTGRSFCEVASTAANSPGNTTITDCDKAVKPFTLYAVMLYSGISGTLNIILTFLVGPLGKRRTSLLVFSVSTCCAICLLFVKIPLLSIALFYCFLYIALILGNINTYLIELNPTYLRGMATCLSVVVARGFGFLSVQIIGTLLADYCTTMIAGYIALLICGLFAAFFLPADLKEKNKSSTEQVMNSALKNGENTNF